MKKMFLSLSLTILMLLVMTGPVMANGLLPGIGTSVTIGGGGDTPVVKCKWEQEPDNNITLADGTKPTNIINNLESGDTSHSQYPGASGSNNSTSYSQFNPPMAKGATKEIDYYAIVPKLNIGTIQAVFALVFHPVGVPAPYNNFWNNPTHSIPDPGASTALAPYFKYKIEYSIVGNLQTGNINYNSAVASLFSNAYSAHLIKFGDTYTYAEALDELNQGQANLWMGSAQIDYEQPAGDYTVNVYAANQGGTYSTVLSNYFNYVPTSGIEVDFNALNYGPIQLGQEAGIGGDIVWNTPLAAAPNPNPATVRNIGNTWAHVTVAQTDMGFGWVGGGNAPVGYSSIGNGTSTLATPPSRSATNWNVYYDTDMGANLYNKVYYTPNVTVTLPNYMGLSTISKLDFSIFVFQGSNAVTHSGTLTLGSVIEPFNPQQPPG
jgi:hypothetical protein